MPLSLRNFLTVVAIVVLYSCSANNKKGIAPTNESLYGIKEIKVTNAHQVLGPGEYTKQVLIYLKFKPGSTKGKFHYDCIAETDGAGQLRGPYTLLSETEMSFTLNWFINNKQPGSIAKYKLYWYYDCDDNNRCLQSDSVKLSVTFTE